MNFDPEHLENYDQTSIMRGTVCQLIAFTNTETKQKFYIVQGKINQNIHFNQNLFDVIKKNECFNIISITNKIQRNEDILIQIEQCDFTLYQYMLNRKSHPFSSEEIYDILSQIINAYIHIAKYTNQSLELSPSNILIRKLKNQKILIKIFINFFNSEQKSAYNFSHYKAPEELNNSLDINLQTDIFLLGIILFQLCYKVKPTEGINNVQDLKKFQEDLIRNRFMDRLENQDGVDQFLKNLIGKMLEYYQNDRITWKQLSMLNQLHPNFHLLKNKYYINLNQSLGRGSQGVTYFVENLETNQNLCAKIIDITQVEGQREQEIYEKLIKQHKKNKNVIEILDIILSQDEQSTFLIMEICESNIEEYFKKKNRKLRDEEIMDMLKQIVNGYCYLKDLDIIHRDLKPQNILVKHEKEIPIYKIIDFGVGKIIADQNLAVTVAGTPIFSAPEVIDGKQYDYQCDIFSVLIQFILARNHFVLFNL
ncbi:unnamed protein product (macronuclear) [Paramecium tetraurelia]|uniref:Protein kinase domain-containing protein n=1 Tax=Paramecium tetraurelia TaxID=5888 RepID=A0BLK6_PARTE|nr:uncharacterized protein GSPATT00030056001 [Paramecium tetraurelia]CAK59423.1 unnamed protein product [Paramecium tetraurelia]|eukprot:XP_001426821.1 hypothetical protein (macronuclear) [Paramecium tetraurelia strain d4-2]